MNKRTMDELISYFNKEVSKMDISREYKMALLGMITAIGYESKKQEVVRCKDCKYGITDGTIDGFVFCSKPYTERGNAMHRTDWFCADGARKEQDDLDWEEPADLEMGYDPYLGCYTDDC